MMSDRRKLSKQERQKIYDMFDGRCVFRYFSLQELSENLVNNILNLVAMYENASEELSVLLKKYDLWKENESLLFEEADKRL